MREILKLGGTSFHPSAANTGNENTTVLRGKNMMLRGSEGSFYFEAYGGHKNLNEPIPIMQLTGQISYVDGSLVVTGVGTSFKTELRFGQKFIAGNPLQVLVPDDIISNTRMIVQRAPDASGTLEDAFKPAHLFEINNQRGTLVWGNAVKSDRGNIIAVGEGRLRLNGELLAGDDFVASRRLKLAIFDPNTQTYTVDEMGFNSAPSSSGVSISVVAGGVKDMTQGTYSFRWSWADSTTGFGFSNPSEVIKLDASNNPIAITATNQRFKLDFTAGLPSKPTNADSIIVYRSLFSDPTQNPTQAAEGSWFVASTTKISALETGDILYIDVLDGELSTEVTFDNDAPPDADWVSFLAGDPILISCYGDKVVGGSDRGASPGPFVSPSRRGNRHGFPAATATVLSPPDTIIGFLPGVGRLFLLTRTGLPFAAATGQSDFPVETRAFWQTGFKSPYGLVFINDTLYAFTHKGPTRSIATGDVGGEQFAFAGAVEEITREWHAGYVHAVHDPQNELIVLIYSASHRNDDGFWVSLALPYYLRYGVFGPLIEISKPDRDMIVTGAASVGGKLQFLAGGRGAIDVFSSEESSEEGSSEEAPVLEPGPVQWLRPEELSGYSNGDIITLWEDHSTNNNDATGASTGTTGPLKRNAELDGFSGASFHEGASANLLSLLHFGPITAAEVMIVIKAADDPPALSPAGVEVSGLWAFHDQDLANHFPYPDGHVYEHFGATDRKDVGNLPGSLSSTYRLYGITSGTNDYRVFLEGVAVYTTTTNTPAIGDAGNNAGRMCSIGISGAPLFSLIIPKAKLKFVEYILWDQQLTDPERAEWVDYLLSKYPSIP